MCGETYQKNVILKKTVEDSVKIFLKYFHTCNRNVHKIAFIFTDPTKGPQNFFRHWKTEIGGFFGKPWIFSYPSV